MSDSHVHPHRAVAFGTISCLMLLAVLPNLAHTFVLHEYPPSQRVTLNVILPDESFSSIGYGITSFQVIAEDSAAGWNRVGVGRHLDTEFFTLSADRTPGDPCNSGDGLNTVDFTETYCGLEWGDIAAATRRFGTVDADGNIRIVENDILFNATKTWDAYPAAGVANTSVDFRRVVTHELGHVVGLAHPDEHGQRVDAIMNSRVSATNAIQQDDIDGVQAVDFTPPPTIVPMVQLRLVTLRGNGTVTSDPRGLDCPGDCVEDYPVGTAVTLQAIPAEGHIFSGWDGQHCQGSECTIVLDEDQQMNARFVPEGPLPDLMGTITKFIHKVQPEGDTLVIKMNICNVGPVAALGPFHVGMFLSHDDLLSSDDPLIQFFTVDKIEPHRCKRSKKGKRRFKVAQLESVDGKVVFIHIDQDHRVTERNLRNNVVVHRIKD